MQAINNAEALSKFRAELRALGESLNNALKETEHAVEQLSQTWKDTEFQKFTAKFNEDKEEIRSLSQKIIEFESQTLFIKQKKIEKYLGSSGGSMPIAAGAALAAPATLANGGKKQYINKRLYYQEKVTDKYDGEKITEKISSKQSREALSDKEIEKLLFRDPEKKEVDKINKEFKDAGIDFTKKDGVNYNKLDSAFSSYYGLKNEDDLILVKEDFEKDKELAGKPYAGVHWPGTNEAKINGQKYSDDIISCDEVELAMHETKHVVQEYASSAEKEIFNKGRVDFLKCEGEPVYNNTTGEYQYYAASDDCKLKFEDYLKSPEEAPAFQAGANAKKACEELKQEQEAQLFERPKRIMN